VQLAQKLSLTARRAALNGEPVTTCAFSGCLSIWISRSKNRVFVM